MWAYLALQSIHLSIQVTVYISYIESLMLVANNRIEVEKVFFISWNLCSFCKMEHEHLQCFLEKSHHRPNIATSCFCNNLM